MTRAITLLLLLSLAVPAAAQEREIRNANLPSALEARLLAMFEGGAERYDGAATIRAGQVVRTSIAAMGGPLRVAGKVDGDVAMVGGDVILEPGGVITGSVTVVSGEVRMADDAVVGGTITAYGVAPSDRRAERRPGRDERRAPEPRVRYPDQGFSRFTVRTGVGYNRVEGLPIMFGPVLQTAGRNPLRLEALAIWRTEAGASLATDRMGYRLRAEQFLAPERRLSVGATAFSMVDPLDRWQLRDVEASLGAALFGQDFRDHYDRTGWDAFVNARPLNGAQLRLTYRDERHSSLPAGDPWALFNRSADWRLQPMVAEGRVRTVGASAELDRRDRREDPRSGWHASVAVDRPVGGSLTRPALTAVGPSPHPRYDEPVAGFIPATPMDLDFATGLLDVRRYNPVGHRSSLNLRLVAGGSLTESPLPPQFQHALGGPGTLPGFDAFHGDCGARRATGMHDDHRFFPAYGCDRFALGQVEYRGRLSLDFGIGDLHHDRRHEWWPDVSFDAGPTWAVFMNAGRGWAFADPATGDPERRETGTLVDAGLGILFGKLGLYAALPLNADVDQSPRFFLRWGARF